MKFRKRPVIVEAVQWFKMGDHPGVEPPRKDDPLGECLVCSWSIGEHGRIQTLEGGHIVCPGDWIITGVAQEIYPCKPDIFAKTYEPVPDEPVQRPEGFGE